MRTVDPNVASFLLANPFFQPDPGLASQAIIDPNRINSVAQNYIANGLIPTSPSLDGQITSQGRFSFNSDEVTGKFDFDLNEKNKLSLTLGMDRAHNYDPFNDSSNVLGYPVTADGHDYFLNFAYTHIFSASLLNEARITLERSYNLANVPPGNCQSRRSWVLASPRTSRPAPRICFLRIKAWDLASAPRGRRPLPTTPSPIPIS